MSFLLGGYVFSSIFSQGLGFLPFFFIVCTKKALLGPGKGPVFFPVFVLGVLALLARVIAVQASN